MVESLIVGVPIGFGDCIYEIFWGDESFRLLEEKANRVSFLRSIME